MAMLASKSQIGYGSSAVRTSRDVEYEALSRITGMIKNASASGDRLAEIRAVGKNIELWTLLGSDLTSEKNLLPKDLREKLLNVARFSLRHSHNVLIKTTTTEALIDVNISIMKGLRSGDAS